jgi:hypothetical protein
MRYENYTATDLLRELFETVKGECPSLLNEDSGGDGDLCIAIEDCLRAADQPDAAPTPREHLLMDLLAEAYEYIDADASEQPPLMARIREALGVGDRPADQQNAMSTGACYCQLHDRYSIDGCPECRMPPDKT